MSRERRDLLLLFLLSLVVRLATAAFISRAGYMDPAYYAAGAVNLATGRASVHMTNGATPEAMIAAL